ncbi:MAG: aryl-sulfate sulfotransferase [Bacteroidota bacterium]|jgi:hypothetical protein
MLSALFLLMLLTDTHHLSVQTSGNQAQGYYLISGVNDDSVGLVDNSGRFLFALQSGPTTNMQPSADGGFTYFDGSLQAYVRVDSLFLKVDTFRISAPYLTDFHEGYQTADGRYIILGTETRTIDMSVIFPGGKPNAQIIGAVIQEYDRSKRLTFEWKSLDHVAVTESTIDIDITHNRIDYLHANAIIEDLDGNFIVSCRNTDQIIKISRSTGAVLWRLGGSAATRSDFTFVNDAADGFSGFSHQHTPIITRNGELMLFDNGTLKAEPFARVVAYRLNLEERTATKTWEYRPAINTVVPTMGSVQELPNGNILVGWGTNSSGMIATEVDRGGRIHAEISSADLPAYPYRVYKAVIGMKSASGVLGTSDSLHMRATDTTVGLKIRPVHVAQPVSVSVERHATLPAAAEYADLSAPCMIFPERWMLALPDSAGNTYSATFDLGHTVAERDPSSIAVYQRPQEGSGTFRRVTSAVIIYPSTITIASAEPGEYIVGSSYCIATALIYPPTNAIDVSTSPRLDWSRAVGADEYEVELSTSPYFDEDPVFFRTEADQTRLESLRQGTTYWWHVRVIRGHDVGDWSEVRSFTTERTTSVSAADLASDLPVETRIIAYDLLGNELARDVIVREGQPLFRTCSERTIIVVATTPKGQVRRFIAMVR